MKHPGTVLKRVKVTVAACHPEMINSEDAPETPSKMPPAPQTVERFSRSESEKPAPIEILSSVCLGFCQILHGAIGFPFLKFSVRLVKWNI